MLKLLFKPIWFIAHLLMRIVKSGLNGRNIITLPLNFGVNFLPIFTWLTIFKNAGVIPKEIRPKIFVTLMMNLDDFLFSFSFSGVFSLFLLVASAYGLYIFLYKESISLNSSNSPFDLEQNLDLDFELGDLPNSHSNSMSSNSMNSNSTSSSTVFENDSDLIQQPLEFLEINPQSLNIKNNEINALLYKKLKSNNFKPLNSFYLAPPILLATCWIVLNIDYQLREPINQSKDLVAWFSYVIGHFCCPLFTAIWLYVFHAPGALAVFSYSLGLQNILGVFTHLLFPNAPPWFIHLNGPDSDANYDMPGYAAGLTRIDVALGTHLHSQGFHASPIVFGAFPSLHSAMAVMSFFFVSYYSRWYILKAAAGCFVMLQWWATMYLDHHWRVDLLGGLFYSIFAFSVFRWLRVKTEKKFIDSRLNYDWVNGSTMGMRVFKNTKLQNFFDPYA